MTNPRAAAFQFQCYKTWNVHFKTTYSAFRIVDKSAEFCIVPYSSVQIAAQKFFYHFDTFIIRLNNLFGFIVFLSRSSFLRICTYLLQKSSRSAQIRKDRKGVISVLTKSMFVGFSFNWPFYLIELSFQFCAFCSVSHKSTLNLSRFEITSECIRGVRLRKKLNSVNDHSMTAY